MRGILHPLEPTINAGAVPLFRHRSFSVRLVHLRMSEARAAPPCSTLWHRSRSSVVVLRGGDVRLAAQAREPGTCSSTPPFWTARAGASTGSIPAICRRIRRHARLYAGAQSAGVPSPPDRDRGRTPLELYQGYRDGFRSSTPTRPSQWQSTSFRVDPRTSCGPARRAPTPSSPSRPAAPTPAPCCLGCTCQRETRISAPKRPSRGIGSPIPLTAWP
jgi:hypothetical protein